MPPADDLDPNANSNCHGYRYGYSNRYSNRYSYIYPYSHSYVYPDSYGYGYGYAYTVGDGNGSANHWHHHNQGRRAPQHDFGQHCYPGNRMAQRGWSAANSCQPIRRLHDIVTVGATVTMAAPWNFSSGPLPALWSVGGFTFDLTASSIVPQGNGFLNVSGTGTITGNGFDPTPGSWRFSTQNPPANGVFSFSASTTASPPTPTPTP